MFSMDDHACSLLLLDDVFIRTMIDDFIMTLITLHKAGIHYKIHPDQTLDETFITPRIHHKCCPTILDLLKNSYYEIYPLWPDMSLIITGYNEKLLDELRKRSLKYCTRL